MSRKYTITVTVEADESDLLLNTDAIREGIASFVEEFYGVDGSGLHGWQEVSALVSAVRVDGRLFDAESRTLEETPITPQILNYLLSGRKILAIKTLRVDNPMLSLAEAKGIVDKWTLDR